MRDEQLPQSREILSIKLQAANDYVTANEKLYSRFVTRLELLKIDFKSVSDNEFHKIAVEILDEALQGSFSTSLILEDIHQVQKRMIAFDHDVKQLEDRFKRIQHQVHAGHGGESGVPPKILMLKYLESMVPVLYKYLEPVRELRREFMSRLETAPTNLGVISSSEDEFRREGHHWKVSFDGKAELLNDLAGMFYIHHLLDKPGELFTAGQMRNYYFKYKNTNIKSKTSQELHGELNLNSGTDLGLQIDSEGIRNLKSRYCDLREDLENARTSGDDLSVERLEVEMETIENEMRAAVGLNGQGRAMSDRAKVDLDTVRNDINRCLKSIQGKFFELGTHLDKSLTRKKRELFSYKPEKPRPWKT